jgi:uncharacterized protein (DUF58 family)
MDKLKQIIFKTKRQIFSEKIGNNSSIFKGEGYDFLELREYMPGDNIKFIDWNITAKLQTPYVKVFHEEREINVVIASTLNGSVHFGSTKLKQDLIAEITALLSFSSIKNSDTFSSFIYTDKLESFTKPSKRINAVTLATKEIIEFDAMKKGLDLKKMGDSLFLSVKKRSLIFIIGDFFEIPDFKILAKKHEVIIIIARDRLEENPPLFGLATLEDPQTGLDLEGDFSKTAINKYKTKVKLHDQALYQKLRLDGIRFKKIYTHSNIWLELQALLDH